MGAETVSANTHISGLLRLQLVNPSLGVKVCSTNQSPQVKRISLMTDHTGSSYKGYIGIDRKSGDMDQSPRPLTQTLTFGLWDGVIPMIHAWGWGGGEFGGNSAKEFEKGNITAS